jgi:hypothetical protein
MSIRELKREINTLIGDDSLEKAFEVLTQHFDGTGEPARDVTLLKMQLNRASKSFNINGTLQSGEYKIERNRIAASLFDFVGNLDPNTLDKTNAFPVIDQRLILLTATDETERAMAAYLSLTFFPKLESYFDDTFKAVFNNSNDPDHDILVVFDHFEHEGIQVEPDAQINHTQRLEWLLNETGCYILWFGPHHNMVAANNKRMYAANFRFALYARIQEMLDFMQRYQGEAPKPKSSWQHQLNPPHPFPAIPSVMP